MTAEDKVKVWRARLRYAAEKRRVFYEGIGADDDGARCGAPGAQFAIEVFRGNSRPAWWPIEDFWIHIGKLKAAIRAAVPSLLYRDPEYKVFPAAKDVEAGADVAYNRSKAKALWLNHWWRESHGSQHARIGIQNAFFDIGVVKAGYLCDSQDSEERGVFATNDLGEYVIGPDGDPVLESGELLYDKDGEKLRDQYGFPVPHPGTVTKEEWYVQVIDCHFMLFDVDSGPDFHQHRWVAEEWLRPLSEVKNDPRFPLAKRKRLKATDDAYDGRVSQRRNESRGDIAGDGSTVEAVTRDQEMVRGYDIYDFQTGEYLVLPAEGLEDRNEEFLLDEAMPDGMEHGPYRCLKYTEDTGTEWYPIPDAIDMALANVEYNVTCSQEFIHRDHTKTRYEVLAGTFGGEGANAEEEMAKWAHAADGTAVSVTRLGGIQPLNKGQLDGSFMRATPRIALDFNEVGGMPGEMRGVADSDTATQASILATGAEIRNNDRRDNQVALWLQEIGRVLLMSGQANAEQDSLVIEKVIEQTGVSPFKATRLTPKELQGEFEVTLEVGSTQAKNDPRVLQQIQGLLANIGQNPVLGLFKGLNMRLLDGMGLDPVLSQEIFDASMAFLESQQKPAQGSPEGPPAQQGQELAQMLMGQGNAAGGAPTGAPQNNGAYG